MPAQEIPLALWPRIREEALRLQRANTVDGRWPGGKIPYYAICRFCGGLHPFDMVTPEEGEEFRVRVVAQCPTCLAVRKISPDLYDFFHRVFEIHLQWYSHELADYPAGITTAPLAPGSDAPADPPGDGPVQP